MGTGVGEHDVSYGRDESLERARRVLAHDEEAHPYDAVVPPIVQTSLFTFATYAEMAQTFAGQRARNVYSRTTNPTVAAFERKIAALEVTEDAIGFPSGMAAISATVLASVAPGDRLLCVRHVYPDAYRFFETFLRRFGIRVEYVDGTDLAAVEAQLPGTSLVYLESPTSWTMQALDLPGIAALCRRHGVTSVIDNSWASPIFQRPIELGVDVVLHSASKYIGGHSDTVAGVVAGPTALLERIRRHICPYIGAKLAPFEAWLLLRGLRTLAVRMLAHEASARVIGERLASHARVTRVHHPALSAPLPPGLLGTSGLFSFELADGVDIPRFCDSLQYFSMGVSWGGHESLIFPAAVARVQAAGPNPALAFDIPPRMVRVSIGLEGTELLWHDLRQALEAASQ